MFSASRAIIQLETKIDKWLLMNLSLTTNSLLKLHTKFSSTYLLVGSVQAPRNILYKQLLPVFPILRSEMKFQQVEYCKTKQFKDAEMT